MSDQVSVNHVDGDGNTTIHIAAASGLVECVVRLIGQGAIISIVNRDQKTCCEMADSGGWKSLADSLEVALLYQVEDMEMSDFFSQNAFAFEKEDSILILGTQCSSLASLEDWLLKALDYVSTKTGLSTCRSEALLDHFAYDVAALVKAYTKDPLGTLDAAKLARNEVTWPVFDSSPWKPHPSPHECSTEWAGRGIEGEVVLKSGNSPLSGIPPSLSVNTSVNTSVKTSLETVPTTGHPAMSGSEAMSESESGSENREADSVMNASTTLQPPVDPSTLPVPPMSSEAESALAAESTSVAATSDPDPFSVTPPPPPPPLPSMSPVAEASPSSSSSSSSSSYAHQQQENDLLNSVFEPCVICGEDLYSPVAPYDFSNKDQVVWNRDQRLLQCPAGHRFCLLCWSTSVHMQLKDGQLSCLQCPVCFIYFNPVPLSLLASFVLKNIFHKHFFLLFATSRSDIRHIMSHQYVISCHTSTSVEGSTFFPFIFSY